MTSSNINAVPSSPFTNILNFRDVGATINVLCGQPLIQPGLLYRSARPDEASARDRQLLKEKYRLRTIVDLRSETEHIQQVEKLRARRLQLSQDDETQNGDDTIQDGDELVRIPDVTYEIIDFNGGAFTRALLWRLSWTSLARLLGLMATGYRVDAVALLCKEVMAPSGLIALCRDSLDISTFKVHQIFSLLAKKEIYPVLVHCTQGKDRTGLVVLLVLLLLKVPVDAIKADYIATERELEVGKEENLKEIERVGLSPEFATCPRVFIDAMESHLQTKYGGVENYLESCGVDEDMRTRIRTNLLTPGEG